MAGVPGHGAGGRGEEVGPPAGGHARGVGEAEVRLVDEVGRGEGVAGALVAEAAVRERAQLVVDEGVEAARVVGSSNVRIITRHIFPNVVPIVIIWASLFIPALILTEAALSFLGLGVRPPTPSWGNMLQDARGFYRQAWTFVFIAGFMIYITVLSIYLVGSGLRDALDPRLSEK